MTLIKFNKRFPWHTSVFDNFLDAPDFFNDDFFESQSLMPAMNVKEKDTNFEIELAAPGFSKEDFNITIDNGRLHISAEKRKEEEEKKEGYIHKEFNYSSFKRSIKLPENIDQEKDIKAKFKNGILKLKLLKKEEVKETPKKVIDVL